MQHVYIIFVCKIEKPDSQLSDKLKEDEVSSSEEACKADRQLDDGNKEGMCMQTDLKLLANYFRLKKPSVLKRTLIPM